MLSTREKTAIGFQLKGLANSSKKSNKKIKTIRHMVWKETRTFLAAVARKHFPFEPSYPLDSAARHWNGRTSRKCAIYICVKTATTAPVFPCVSRRFDPLALSNAVHNYREPPRRHLQCVARVWAGGLLKFSGTNHVTKAELAHLRTLVRQKCKISNRNK